MFRCWPERKPDCNKLIIESKCEELLMQNCPCGMEKPYEKCCGPFIKGDALPQTPEALMRSRYTAFTKTEVDYILNTVHPEKREQHDEKTVQNWAKNSDWIGLKILNTEKGGPDDTEGVVEFKVQYYHSTGIIPCLLAQKSSGNNVSSANDGQWRNL